METNLYKLALKEQYLFKSNRGMLSTEDLFELPLEGNNGLNLDKIAQSIDADITQDGKQSFVKANAVNPTNANKMEIVKDIIHDKLVAQEARKTAASNKVKREKILTILASKQDDAMANKSEAELLAELAAVS